MAREVLKGFTIRTIKPDDNAGLEQVIRTCLVEIGQDHQVLEEIAGIEPPYEIKVCKERSMTDYRSMAEYVAGIKGSVMEDK